MNHGLWIAYGAQVGATLGFWLWGLPRVLESFKTDTPRHNDIDGDGDI